MRLGKSQMRGWQEMSERKRPQGEDSEVEAVPDESEVSGRGGEMEEEDAWRGWLEASSRSSLRSREWMRLSLMGWKVMGEVVLSE